VCHYFAGGDMREQTLREAWNRASLREFRRTVRDGQVFPGCHGCCNLTYTGPKEFGLAGVREQTDVARPAAPALGPVLAPTRDHVSHARSAPRLSSHDSRG
jgi:hypothetical protein